LVFIEVNEMGQFLFLEQRNPQFSMLDAFAEFLMRRDQHFEYSFPSSPITLSDFHRETSRQVSLSGHVEFSRHAQTNESAMAASR